MGTIKSVYLIIKNKIFSHISFRFKNFSTNETYYISSKKINFHDDNN